MVKLNIKMYSAAIASGDNIASFIVPVSSSLVGVSWCAQGTVAGAIGGAVLYQLSTQSTRQFAVNDARGIIDEFILGLTAAVNINGADNKFSVISGWKFAAGDRVYLHLQTLTAFGAGQVNVNLQLA